MAPGFGFGEYGDEPVRIGLVENTHRIRQATGNIEAFMKYAAPHGGQTPEQGKNDNE